jgi:uncharacterized OB-fold protein
MPYLPPELPFPEPTAESAPFWEHIAQGRLMFQACGDCGLAVHPPLPVCPACQAANRTWMPAPATGRVFTYTIAHYASHEAVQGHLPYNIAVIEFPDLPGVRLVSNVIDVAPENMAIGMSVEPVFEAAAIDRKIVRFREKHEL